MMPVEYTVTDKRTKKWEPKIRTECERYPLSDVVVSEWRIDAEKGIEFQRYVHMDEIGEIFHELGDMTPKQIFNAFTDVCLPPYGIPKGMLRYRLDAMRFGHREEAIDISPSDYKHFGEPDAIEREIVLRPCQQ